MATTLTCLRCGGDLDDGDRYCAACGVESLRCKSCSQQLLPTDLTCPHCGTHRRACRQRRFGARRPARCRPISTTSSPGSGARRWASSTSAASWAAAAWPPCSTRTTSRSTARSAIKVMSPGLVLGEGMTERFKQEAITVAQLHHPSIVPVYSVRQAEGLHFFVMQYVQGRSLEQVLQQARRLPLPIVRSILYQVGSALTYAHRARRDPPGRQARQHPDRPGRQRGRHRLRHRQGGRAADPDADRRAGGHAGVHEPGAVRRRRGLGPVRPVLARRGGLRAGHRRAAVRRLHPHRHAGARRARAAARSAELLRRLSARGRGGHPPHAGEGSGRAGGRGWSTP